jgi:hypothetical protein
MPPLNSLPADAGILIHGKQQGTKAANHELHGRVALAAGLWHAARRPTLPIFFVAADTHGPTRVHDGTIVGNLLTQRYRVPTGVVHVRRWSLCTLVEVRAMRALARIHGIGRVLAITHPYHTRRAAAYFAQIGLAAEMLPVHPATLAGLTFPTELAETWREIHDAVVRSLPRRLDLVRERAVEAALTLLHRVDARGKVERRLAAMVRR